jgi:uncharacterized protein YciI
MDKVHYTLYLNPPRPTFMQDMNEEERSIMQKHVGYWNHMMAEGKVLAFGPVLDPKGVYGLGIVEVENEEQVKAMIANDPANGLNKYEYYVMRAVTPKKAI